MIIVNTHKKTTPFSICLYPCMTPCYMRLTLLSTVNAADTVSRDKLKWTWCLQFNFFLSHRGEVVSRRFLFFFFDILTNLPLILDHSLLLMRRLCVWPNYPSFPPVPHHPMCLNSLCLLCLVPECLCLSRLAICPKSQSQKAPLNEMYYYDYYYDCIILV